MRGCIDGQRLIDELRIVPLVSLDDARGDVLQIKYDKTCQNLLILQKLASFVRFIRCFLG
jgi:hypothetical protein